MHNREPVQIVNVYIPVLVEFVAVAFAFAVAALWIGICAGRV